jgi:predicted transcriptional regulator
MKTEITIKKIKESIELLQKSKPDYTYEDIARQCGISKQRVHFIMRKNGLTTGRVQESSEMYYEKLKDIDTASMTVRELGAFIGYKKRLSTLRRILKLNNLKCKFEKSNPTRLENKLKALDTTNMTEREIANAIDYRSSITALRAMLKYHGLQCKSERQCGSTLFTLRDLETEGKTIDELVVITKYKFGIFSLKAMLKRNDIQFKKT